MKTALWLVFFAAICLVYITPSKTFAAANLSLQTTTSQLQKDDTYTVQAVLSINVADGTLYFLRGAFYQSGTTNYCGYTWNGASWFNGPYTTNNGWQNLLQIEVHNSSWSGQLQAKIDPTDSGCSNSGTYNFKIERFTVSGSGNWDSQNEQTVIVVIPTPTPTPLPLPTPSPIPTNTPTPTLVPTKQITMRPTVKVVTPTISSHSAITTTTAMVLGIKTTATPSPVPKKETRKMPFDFIPILTIGSGMLILIYCGILFYQNYRKKGETENE